MNTVTLDVLASAWRKAKQDETDANARRLDIEAQMVAALPSPHPEGSVSQEVNGWRLRIAYKLTRKVDSDALQSAWGGLTPAQRDVFRWKADINLKQLRAVQQLLPQEHAALASFIETAPAKPSVTVEEVTP